MELNSDLLHTIFDRREVSVEIQELKTKTDPYPNFDPHRERDLFGAMKESLKELSLKELLAFSLIMEAQAQAISSGAYPHWSQSQHLEQVDGRLEFMINPILLKLTHPERFELLKLKAEFVMILGEVI
jgi:chorismate mutase